MYNRNIFHLDFFISLTFYSIIFEAYPFYRTVLHFTQDFNTFTFYTTFQ